MWQATKGEIMYEQINRLRKAETLASHINETMPEMTAKALLMLEEPWWQRVSQAAGVNVPSVQTMALVVGLIRARDLQN